MSKDTWEIKNPSRMDFMQISRIGGITNAHCINGKNTEVFEFKNQLNRLINEAIALRTLWEELGEELHDEVSSNYPFDQSFEEVVTSMIKWDKSIK